MPCKIIQAGVASQKPRQHMTDGNDMSDYPGRNHGSDVKEGIYVSEYRGGNDESEYQSRNYVSDY